MTKIMAHHGFNDCKEVSLHLCFKYAVKAIMLAFAACVFFSCSTLFSAKNKTEQETGTTQPTKTKSHKGELVSEESKEPLPGDIKVIDGVEYIYTRNRKYMSTSNEPENVWIRKDQYAPGLVDSIVERAAAGSKKERSAMEQRIARLEEELKKKGVATQKASSSQITSLPPAPSGNASAPVFTVAYPSPNMKRRVIVLPIIDETHYKHERFEQLATKSLISRLENTKAIICIYPSSVNMKGQLTDPENMKTLNEAYGIQAVLRGTLSDTVTDTSLIVLTTHILVYNAETGTVLKEFSGRSPVSFSTENVDSSQENAKTKSIDASIELIADDLLKNILTIDWHARIASIENDKIYINAGRLSGLENGSTLEVYSPGKQVVDPKTNTSLGMAKGNYKGELRVVELFGVDASWARPIQGNNFAPSDLVYLRVDPSRTQTTVISGPRTQESRQNAGQHKEKF
jgi:hypothetical protein